LLARRLRGGGRGSRGRRRVRGRLRRRWLVGECAPDRDESCDEAKLLHRHDGGSKPYTSNIRTASPPTCAGSTPPQPSGIGPAAQLCGRLATTRRREGARGKRGA